MIFLISSIRKPLLLASSLLATTGITSGALIFEGFDSGLPNSGNQGAPGLTLSLPSGNWFAINESTPIGSTGVTQGDATSEFLPNSGTGFARFDYNNAGTPSPATISTWLMSPSQVFSNGDTITFYTQTAGPVTWPDRLRLRLSTSGNSTLTSDFSNVMVTINQDLTLNDYPVSWTQYTATVTGLSGPTSGRIAFHYDVTDGGPLGANSSVIGIDSVSMDLAALVVPEPSGAMLAAGFGLVAALRRRR